MLHLYCGLCSFVDQFMPVKIKIGRAPNIPQQVCAGILLFLYLLGTAGIESLHNSIHIQEQSVLLAVENEDDPCRVNIYNGEGNAGCDHVSHIVKKDTCSLCNSQLHHAHIILSNVFNLHATLATTASIHNTYVCMEGVYSYPSDRAPPVF